MACASIEIPMEQARDILKAALRGLKDPEAGPAWLAANWHAIAGKSVARHTRPVALHEAVLRIETDSPAWKRQVEAMAEIICAQVNLAWGGTLVRRIRVEEASRSESRVPYAENNRHTPFVRRTDSRHHED